MTTEKKSETATTPTVNDNKAVFGPLGKYAVVAVIMVSIIVTSAIMLNQQLITVDDQIAAIENEVAESHAIAAKASDIAVSEKTVEVEIVASTVEIKEVTPVETAPVAVVKAAPVSKQVSEAPSAEVVVAIEAKPVTVDETNQVADVEKVETVTTAQTRQTQAAMENQDRIEAYKLEQKQRMAEMFARIRTLESQQLDQYKSRQDEQIARLREQVTSQQEMIDSFVLRNKELFELRAANVKKNQTNREQVLNRI